MKTQKNDLLLFFLWTMMVLLFLSCENGDTVNPLPEIPCDTLTVEDATTFATLEQAMKIVDFEGSAHWSVAIEILNFESGEKRLVVYNPYDSDPNFYDSLKFSVYWFIDGNLVDQRSNTECFRKGEYAVLVVNDVTEKGVGVDFYEILKSCYED